MDARRTTIAAGLVITAVLLTMMLRRPEPLSSPMPSQPATWTRPMLTWLVQRLATEPMLVEEWAGWERWLTLDEHDTAVHDPQTQVLRHGARLMIALHREGLAHHAYPTTIVGLASPDPSFHYRRALDGYLLYHDGPNAHDDGAHADDVIFAGPW